MRKQPKPVIRFRDLGLSLQIMLILILLAALVILGLVLWFATLALTSQDRFLL